MSRSPAKSTAAQPQSSSCVFMVPLVIHQSSNCSHAAGHEDTGAAALVIHRQGVLLAAKVQFDSYQKFENCGLFFTGRQSHTHELNKLDSQTQTVQKGACTKRL